MLTEISTERESDEETQEWEKAGSKRDMVEGVEETQSAPGNYRWMSGSHKCHMRDRRSSCLRIIPKGTAVLTFLTAGINYLLASNSRRGFERGTV